MSYNNPFSGGYNQPSSYSTNYSYSSTGGQPRPSGPTFNDPFAKPSGTGYGSTGGYGGPGGYGGAGGYGAPGGGSRGFGGPSGYGGAGGYGGTGGYGGAGGYGGYGGPSPNYGSTGGYQQPSTTSYSKPTQPTATFGLAASLGGISAKPSSGGPTQDIGKSQKPNQGVLSVNEVNDLSKAGKQLFSNAFAKSSTKSAYQDLLKQLQASGQKYKDLDFPPELRSLTGGLSEYELAASGNPLNWRSLVWLRCDDIYGKGNYKVFQGSIEPNDIKQGALGDCYFLATLAAIAEKPERIRRLFESEESNDQGCYAIKICEMGVWQTVILDDFIPCSSKSKQPVFTKGCDNELWVQLLEKGWSKTYGSYARIEAGLTRECLHDLTGAPTKFFLTGDPNKYEDIWHAIADGEKKDFIMTCGAGDLMEGADLMSSIGLVGSHAYSLLAAITVKDRQGKEVRLVKLRNPWGKGEWTGDWSDESPTWTAELKKQVQLESKDDGIFFMTFQDMLKYFSDIQICKAHDDFSYKSLKSSCDNRHACFFKLTVRTAGHYYITINQESKRKHDEKEDYQYSEVFLVFGKKNGNNYEYVEGYQKADKEVWTDGHLTPGEYLIYCKIAWNEKKTREFSVSSYGCGEVEIEQVPKTYCPNFLEKVYTNKGKQSKKLEDYKHCGVTNCYRSVELTDDGFGFIYYRNESGKSLEEELYFKFLEGLKFRKPYRGNSYKIVVPPKEERIVVTKVIPNASRIRQAFTERSRFV